jgi:hypothetical protein
VYVIFKAFRRLIDEIFIVDNCGSRGEEEGVRDFKCWLDLLFDDGWTLQEPPPPRFYDKVLKVTHIPLKALVRFCC